MSPPQIAGRRSRRAALQLLKRSRQRSREMRAIWVVLIDTADKMDVGHTGGEG